jgi:hypothetical protein
MAALYMQSPVNTRYYISNAWPENEKVFLAAIPFLSRLTEHFYSILGG